MGFDPSTRARVVQLAALPPGQGDWAKINKNTTGMKISFSMDGDAAALLGAIFQNFNGRVMFELL